MYYKWNPDVRFESDRWIKYDQNDRTTHPAIGDNFFVYYLDDEWWDVDIGWWDKGWSIYGRKNDKVTHWMPISYPSPPKKEVI